MSDELWLVVGDRFWQFAVDRKAITVSHLKALLNSTQSDELTTNRMMLTMGQGVSDEDAATLLAMARYAPHAERFGFDSWHQRPHRASCYVSHKLRTENILLSEACKLDENNYEMSLLLDDRCELMIDHQSGRHLSGVVLIEAVRQSMLVVTEGHYLPRDGGRHEFTFHDLSVKFHRYCFPLAAELLYNVRELAIKGGRYCFQIEARITQCDAVVLTATANMTAHISPALSRVEGEQATRSLDLYLSSLRGATVHEEVASSRDVAVMED